MVQFNTVKATPNLEWDGALSITGAQSLRRYRELLEQQRTIPVDKYGIFFAFGKKQFDEGYKDLVNRGLIQEGEKVKNFGNGCYGTFEGIKRWMDEAKAIDNQIAEECDPLEVYYEEYNNFECCLDWDGDRRAVEKVISIYGVDCTRQALDGKRFKAWGTVDAVAAKMND